MTQERSDTPGDAGLDMSVEAQLADAKADALRLHREKMDLWEAVHFPPTKDEINAYRDLFRAELDKRMDTRHPSASPSTESHEIALRQFVKGRSEKFKANVGVRSESMESPALQADDLLRRAGQILTAKFGASFPEDEPQIAKWFIEYDQFKTWRQRK